MKCNLKIAFVGSHGTGKSSGANFLTATIKKTYPKKSVKIIEENIRELSPLFNDNINNFEFQRLAMIDHLHKELMAERIYDVVVCDRSSVDTLVYGLCHKIRLPAEYFSLAINHLYSFQKIFFVRPDSSESGIANDGYRNTNVVFRNEVDQQFERMLNLWGGQYIEIKTSQVFTFPYLDMIGYQHEDR